MGWKYHAILGEAEVPATGPRYHPVEFAPPAGRVVQSDKQFETPQMKYMPYREAMTPGSSATYGKGKPKRGSHRGDL